MELEADEQRRQSLVKWICDERPVLIAGAGTSTSRYGGWQDLLAKLEALAVRHGLGFTPDVSRRRNDFLTYVDDIRDSLLANNAQDRYYHYLTTTYGQTAVPYDEL